MSRILLTGAGGFVGIHKGLVTRILVSECVNYGAITASAGEIIVFVALVITFLSFFNWRMESSKTFACFCKIFNC